MLDYGFSVINVNIFYENLLSLGCVCSIMYSVQWVKTEREWEREDDPQTNLKYE